MKVLHIFNELRPSGAEVMWRLAEPILRANGVETHIFESSETIGIYSANLEAAGYIIHRGSLWKLLLKEHFDAAVVHTECARFTRAAMCRLAGVRAIVLPIHNVFRWEGKAFVKRLCVVHMLRIMGCQFVAVSRSVQKAERRYLHTPLLIWNWVQPICDKDNRHSNSSEIILMTVGNCNEIKNHQFLFEVLKLLPDNYVLWHVGLENEARFHERALVIKLGIGARVRFMGARNDVSSLLSKADVFVMSSLREGLGIACIEALMSGIPAVVSDVEGLVDIAGIASSCKCVALDAEKFAITIKEVINCQSKIRAQMKSERSALMKNFSMIDNVTKYIELWRKILKGEV